MIRKLAFGLVAAIFVAMVLEGLSRLFLAGVNPSGFDDASWRTHWLRSHAERGELYYEFDVFDPRLGWMARPGLRDEPAWHKLLDVLGDLGPYRAPGRLNGVLRLSDPSHLTNPAAIEEALADARLAYDGEVPDDSG